MSQGIESLCTQLNNALRDREGKNAGYEFTITSQPGGFIHLALKTANPGDRWVEREPLTGERLRTEDTLDSTRK